MNLHIIKYIFLPPVINSLLIIAGLLLLLRGRWRSGIFLIISSIILLLSISIPMISYQLRHPLEKYSPPQYEELKKAQAIVVLGGGRDYFSPEFGDNGAPNNRTLRRISYAAYLYRKTRLPILVTGGHPHEEKISEAKLMKNMFSEVFDINVRWSEEKSRNTHENALYSARLLKKDRIKIILLVTQAWHLSRAVPEFSKHGLKVIPAPTDFAGKPGNGIMNWIPRSYYLEQSTFALHEWMGKLFYSMFY